MNKYIYAIFTDFLNSYQLNSKEKKLFLLFLNFININYKDLTISNKMVNIIEKFILLYHSNNINKNIYELNISLNIFKKLFNFINTNCNIFIIFNYDNILIQAKRISFITNEINNILSIPILSYKPLIVNLNNYKEYSFKKQKLNKYKITDRGYFIFISKCYNNCIIIKNITTNKFYKLLLSSNIINLLETNDILHIEIKKDDKPPWEISILFKFYPYIVKDYLSNKIYKVL